MKKKQQGGFFGSLLKLGAKGVAKGATRFRRLPPQQYLDRGEQVYSSLSNLPERQEEEQYAAGRYSAGRYSAGRHSSSRCSAKTKKGKRCKRKAMKGKRRCYQH